VQPAPSVSSQIDLYHYMSAGAPGPSGMILAAKLTGWPNLSLSAEPRE
jgi:hypothetical protein